MPFTEEETARHFGEIEELFWSKRRPRLHLWERDLILTDYGDPSRNVYEVTEEWAFHNGHYGTREDAIGFSYGVTWNTVRRNIFAWKREDFEPRISRMGTEMSSGDPCPFVSSVVEPLRAGIWN